MISEVHNIDCMEFMRDIPDKFFDLAVVDPEYGISVNHNMGRRKGQKKSNYKPAYWDKKTVNKVIIDEILRVSVNQIIWGANHFISKMPYDSSCWIMWDKLFSDEVTFAQFELAWTSFDTTCKKFDKYPAELGRIHPTQKPIALYTWILQKYAKPNDRIFDSHMGSQSSRIAAYDLGFDYWGCELDTDYFNDGCNRFNNHISQLRIDIPVQPNVKQNKLF